MGKISVSNPAPKSLRNEGNVEKTFDMENSEDKPWPCQKYLGALNCCKTLWDLVKNKAFGATKVDHTASYHLEDVLDLSTRMEIEIIKDIEGIKRRKPKNTYTIQKHCSVPLGKIQDLNKNKNENYVLYKHNQACPEKLLPIELDKPVNNIFKRIGKTNNEKSIASCGRDFKDSTDYSSCLFNENLVRLYNHDSFILPKAELNKSYIKIKSSKDTSVSCKLGPDYKLYKKLQELNQKINEQNVLIKKIVKENESLRENVQDMYSNCTWKAIYSCGGRRNYHLSVFPKSNVTNFAKDLSESPESQIEVSMRKYSTPSHKHVNMVNVIHKSNYEKERNIDLNCKAFQNKDACDMLTQVHNMFGAILEREKNLCEANEKKLSPALPSGSHTKNQSTKSLSMSPNNHRFQGPGSNSASGKLSSRSTPRQLEKITQ